MTMLKILIWGIGLTILTALSVMVAHSDPIIKLYFDEPWNSYFISMLSTFAFFSSMVLGFLWGILVVNIFKYIWKDA